jgi:hypothetical protein
MTTFHPQQFDRGQCARQKAGASALQISVTNCTPKLHAQARETRKIQCNNVSSTVRPQIIDSHFLQIEALPLVRTRFLWLTKSSPKTARSPARRSRDGREPSGKKSGEMSRLISAQHAGNGRTVATAMPPDGRADNLQDNLFCAGLGRAMSAPETAKTARLKSQS